MAKPWSSRFIIRSFHQFASKPSAGGNPTSSGISDFIASSPKVIETPNFSSWLLNSQRAHFSSSANPLGVFGKLHAHPELLPRRNLLGFRYFSLNRETGSKIFANKMAKKPALAVRNAVGRYKEAARLQIEAFWKRNYMMVLGAGGLVVCIVLWRLLFGIATTFIGFSEGMAKYGFLALSSAIVAFTVSCSSLVVDELYKH